MSGGQESYLIKVPRWLSEAWLAAPPSAEVAQLDLEEGRLRLVGDIARGRPTAFQVSRRSSPELFSFPPCQVSEEVQVEGLIAESLNVSADMSDQGYSTMVKERVQSTAEAGKRSVLEERLLPLNRSKFLVGEAAREREEYKDDGTPEQLAISRKAIWSLVQRTLSESPDGCTVDEILRRLPRASPFLEVRNALATLSEPSEECGVKRFALRRRKDEEVKTEMKTEQQALAAAKFEQRAKLEQKMERASKLEGRTKLEAKADPDIKHELPDAHSAVSRSGSSRSGLSDAAKRQRLSR